MTDGSTCVISPLDEQSTVLVMNGDRTNELQILRRALQAEKNDRTRLRIRALLLAWRDAATYQEVAQQLGCGESSIGRWAQQFQSDGINGLRSRKPGRQKQRPPIDEEDIAALSRALESEQHKRSIRKIRAVVLAVKDQLPHSEISERLGCSQRSVDRWVDCFYSDGLEGLRSCNSGRPAFLTSAHEDELRNWIHSRLESNSNAPPTMKEIHRFLADELGIKYANEHSIPDILKRMGFTRKITYQWESPEI